MAPDFTMSSASVSRPASARAEKPMAFILPTSRPCLWRSSARGSASEAISHRKWGHSGHS